MRWFVGGAVTLALGALVFAFANDSGIPRVEHDGLWIGTVERGDLMLEVRGPGLLLPSQARWIAAENAHVTLAFIGTKMMLADAYHVPIGWSLGIIVAILGGAVAASLLFPPPAPQDEEDESGGITP